MRLFSYIVSICLFALTTNAQTKFKPTSETFKNGELVYSVVVHDTEYVGQFWPIHTVSLVTKQTDKDLFEEDIAKLRQQVQGVAISPDGMTGDLLMQGKALSQGRPCGDGIVYDYGIVYTTSGGNMVFTHKREQQNFDSLYTAVQNTKNSLFFLPSIFRNGKSLASDKTVEKVFVRRETYAGTQIGVIIFDHLTSYTDAKNIVLGLDRQGSKTTHIYILDGGPTWGQSCKQVNGQTVVIGTRNADVVTNYLVFN